MLELVYTLIVTHVTIVCVTIYLHRHQAHRGVELNSILSHFMRFWLWLTTGMITKEWVSVHRKHHRFCEREGDPHSPKIYGLKRVLFKGAFLYHESAKDRNMVNTYGSGTPDDWLERNIYSAHSKVGLGILFMFNICVFGYVGALIWIIQMIWIPLWAAGVVNGLGHSFGYRNGETNDESRNIVPFGIIIGGEELHNNHHLNPKNPKLSRKWFEFDIGWMWLKLFMFLRLAKLK